MPRPRSWTHQAILSSARGETGPLPDPPRGGWDALAAAAGAQGVHGWVARRLRGLKDVDAAFQVGLQASAVRIAANHLRMRAEARKALSLLHSAGTGAIVLKGPALVERYYDDHTLRSYGDVDLLVRPSDFGAALSALESGGYLLTDRNWDFVVRDLRGQVHLMAPDGLVLELHWHLVNGSRQRRTLRMAPDEIWDAAIEGDLGGSPCFVLRREDEIAHLALHAAMHGCNRLAWLLDIAAAVGTGGDPDWDLVSRRLRRWRFGTGAGLVLALAREWAEAAVPQTVLDDLVRSRAARLAYRRAVDTWDLGDPPRRRRELLFAAAGDDPGASAALVVDAVVPAPGQQPDAPSGGPVYRATVGSVKRIRAKVFGAGAGEEVAEFVPVGDRDEGRKAFLAAVASLARETRGRRVTVVSPSRSIGMSHYTSALAEALSGTVEVEVLDAAAHGVTASTVLGWWRARPAERASRRLLVTSPHWSMPLLLRATRWSGGFVWHDPILDAATRWNRPLHEAYYRLLTARLGVVVLHGAAFRRHVAELGLPASEVLVVPHGFVPEQLVADRPYDPRGPLLFVGRLHPYKGLDVLLGALELLEAGGAAPPVVIGGDGVHQGLVPPRLGSVDVRPGEMQDRALRGLIGSCGAVLLPYERANQSGVLATAFRSGRPVIASRVGSFEEYVEDGVNGLLVPPGDAPALAAAMRRLRDDPELAERLAAGAHATWEEKLAPERWAAEVAEALFR